MTDKTQEQQVIKELLDKRWVGRNWAIQRYISRLGAIICDLKKDGWEFTAKFVKTEHFPGVIGKDYVYTATKAPYHKVVRKADNGFELTTWEKINDHRL
jgi:hypothetical protein